jgi:hypothetical protein
MMDRKPGIRQNVPVGSRDHLARVLLSGFLIPYFGKLTLILAKTYVLLTFIIRFFRRFVMDVLYKHNMQLLACIQTKRLLLKEA